MVKAGKIMGQPMSADNRSQVASPARTEAASPSRRLTEETRHDARPGSGSRQDRTSDRLPRTRTHRDAVDRLARLYCELGTATFDFADGRLLSGQYQARRAALCIEIRRHLVGLRATKGTARG